MFYTVTVGLHSSWTANATKLFQNKNCNCIITQVSTEKQFKFQAVNLSQFYDLIVKL